MLLSKIPVLDAGFVAGVSFYLSDTEIQWLSEECYKFEITDALLSQPRAMLSLKCPLFVNLWLANNGLQVNQRKQDGELETYKPTVADIKSGDHSLDADISQDINSTQAALLINPRAYQQDGCDRFIAQVNTPISVYNELVVSGSLIQWMQLIEADNLPGPIESYRRAIEEVLLAEWKKIHEYREQAKSWHERRRKK